MEELMLPYVLLTLATYRIATDMALERGPFSVFERFRGIFHRRYGEDSWQYEGVGCPICLSFWTSLLLCVATGYTSPVFWLAVAGAASFLARKS